MTENANAKPILVSVHLPKTAGSSFGYLLEQRFGSKLLPDYSDLPINTAVDVRHCRAKCDAAKNVDRDFGSIECIHGHFLPAKYLPLKTSGRAKFVTWLRDPFQRAVSHFNFWQRSYDSENAPALHRRVIEERWSLEQFCFSDEMRNFYAQFLWCFPEIFFDFIGITEHFADDLSFFCSQFLGILPEETPRLNAAPTTNTSQAGDMSMRDRFRAFHAEDYRIYERAIALRTNRLKETAKA
jgi:hypothetical protein